jgi:hypothetical protein
MDLEDRGQTALAWRFLNTYLEDSGDYAGLALLRFYQGYRALVRAKVAAIRLSQPGLDAAARAHGEQDYQDYVRLAERYTRPTPVALLITHGVSGCGKTTLARQVLELVGAIRLRSDIERKRLLGLAPLARTGGGIDQGPYSAAMSARTYARLAELAQQLLQNGFPVIVDATFLKRAQRDAFRQPAAALTVPFRILDLHASHAVLIDRLAARARHIRDASEADRSVLTHQLATREPLGEEERTDIISFDADQPVDLAVLARQLTPLLPTM